LNRKDHATGPRTQQPQQNRQMLSTHSNTPLANQRMKANPELETNPSKPHKVVPRTLTTIVKAKREAKMTMKMNRKVKKEMKMEMKMRAS
jgi:hypothetical protein